ncbi:MAG: hypothetical protein QOF16_1540, partial [Actinomycetota bacterium]|nr:hypothetical protein [Actinomycetota bacterium]
NGTRIGSHTIEDSTATFTTGMVAIGAATRWPRLPRSRS